MAFVTQTLLIRDYSLFDPFCLSSSHWIGLWNEIHETAVQNIINGLSHSIQRFCTESNYTLTSFSADVKLHYRTCMLQWCLSTEKGNTTLQHSHRGCGTSVPRWEERVDINIAPIDANTCSGLCLSEHQCVSKNQVKGSLQVLGV